ncbi:MAG: lytic transglycosylase domain-containing protein [Anaerolineales bacterium]
MTERRRQRRSARRSRPSTPGRSASGAPAVLHLIPIALFAMLLLATLHARNVLARPLIAKLAASGHPSPADASSPADNQFSSLAGFTAEVRHWDDQIHIWASDFDLPPALVATVIQIESCGDPSAQSYAGAMGLFQVMPYHFEAHHDPLVVETNARAGLGYLHRSYQLAEGDVSRTLAGYNGGHGVIHQPVAQWPAETQRYAAWGSGILADLEAGRLPSPTLEAWLAAGGASLCHQAAQRTLAAH